MGLRALHLRVVKIKSLYPHKEVSRMAPGAGPGPEQALSKCLLNAGSVYSLLIYLLMVQKAGMWMLCPTLKGDSVDEVDTVPLTSSFHRIHLWSPKGKH